MVARFRSHLVTLFATLCLVVGCTGIDTDETGKEIAGPTTRQIGLDDDAEKVVENVKQKADFVSAVTPPGSLIHEISLLITAFSGLILTGDKALEKFRRNRQGAEGS